MYRLEGIPGCPGLVVHVRRPSLRGDSALAAARQDLRALEGSVRWYAGLTAAAEVLASCIDRWTLVAGDRPVPPTAAALLDEDRAFVATLLAVWDRFVLSAPAAPAEEIKSSEPEPDQAEVLGFDPANLPMVFAPAEREQASA